MKKNVYVDVELCVGCGACSVACMDQNDIDPESSRQPFRRVHKSEEGHNPNASIHYIAIACMHCEDSPCIMGCPTGAIAKDENTGAVLIKRELCIGCHSCALACPFGMPRYDAEEKLDKCVLCTERVAYGLQPACVEVCPFSALQFISINDIQERKEDEYSKKVVRAIRLPAL